MMPKEEIIINEEMTEEVETEIENDPLIKSNHVGDRPSRKKRSEIWKHFVKVNQNKGAKCHYCDLVLSFAAGSLSNLLRHLRKKHPSVAAGFHYHNGTPLVLESTAVVEPLIIEAEGNVRERLNISEIPIIKETLHSTHQEKRLRTSPDDIESYFRRDHSYGEKAPPNPKEELFGQFVQEELNKFKSELLRRKCKREILQALMKYQQTEDSLYSTKDTMDLSE